MKLNNILLITLLAAPGVAMNAQQAVELGMTGSALDEGGTEIVSMLPLNDPRGNKNVVDLLFADPTVYAEGGKFYAAGTRAYGPSGFTLVESTDLKNWSYARPDSVVLKQGRECWGTTGFWAPQFFKDGDNGYLLAYVANERCCIAHSETINGDYTQDVIEPVDNSAGNIDPFIFKDDDGKYYLYHVRFNGGNILYVGELDPETWKIKNGTLKECFRNTQSWEFTNAYPSSPIMEGPTVIKMDDTYYLFYSANHYMSTDYAVGYATAPSPTGPWTKYSGNPIIHRNIVGEMGSGHGDVFVDTEGNMRYVYHVHNSNTVVHPRRTRIIDMHVDKSQGQPYRISVDPESIIIPNLNNGSRDGQFSGYVRLKAGTYTFTGKDAAGTPVAYGVDAAGRLVADGEPMECTEEGVFRVVADTKNGKVELKRIADMLVRGTIVPSATSLPYAGNGVFAGEVALTKEVAVEYSRKSIYFCINNDNNLNIKRIPGTNNVTVPGDGITGEDIRVNNGTYFVTLDLNNGTFDISAPVDDYRISVFGSSVANGQGAAGMHGYAYLYGEQLKERAASGESANAFYTSGVSIGGNTTTNLLNRYDDLIRDHGKYVIFGLSLGNEGIHGNSAPDMIFNKFRDNMLRLIEMVRADGKIPVVMNNYTRTDFTSTDYNYVKKMNLLIHEWDVPSVNTLGAVDDGAGRWAASLRQDDAHPNDEGHKQFANAIVPSLFDAIAAGKPLPVRNSDEHEIVLEDGATLSFTPEGDLNAFTLSMRVKSDGAGELFRFTNGTDGSVGRFVINDTGKATYYPPTADAVTTSLKNFGDDEYNYVTFTHYYGMGRTVIYFNNRSTAVVKETLSPGTFTIGDKAEYHEGEADAVAARRTISELAFWRSGMNSGEVTAHNNGSMLKSSLEFYAPMAMPVEPVAMQQADADEVDAVYEIPNLATSLNTLMLTVPAKAGIGSVEADGAAAPFPVAYYMPDGKLVSTDATPAEGLYIVRYSDGSARKVHVR